jgi:hypothetical protein
MKTALRLVLLAGLLAATFAGAQTTPATDVELELGVWDASVDGNPNTVAEYEDTDGGFGAELRAELFRAAGSLLLTSHVRGSAEQRHDLTFDIQRFVRSHTAYTTFGHRLTHDPLETLSAATRHGRVVRGTDTDPGREYGIDYSLLEHRTELQLPSLPALTLAFDFRQQEREGVVQHLTISHCDGCHVTGQSRPLEEKTQDIGGEARFGFRGGMVKASYNQRKLTQGVTSISLLYDNALQPELLTPIFDNRVQFDSAQGPLPVDLRPDIKKDTMRLQAALADLGGFAVNAGGVWTSTTNEYANLESDYAGYLLNLARRLGERGNLRWRARAYSVDNDAVFVDTVEPVGTAGPQAGRTYRNIYGYDPDFLRESSLNRDVIESSFDLGWKLPGKAGNLRLLWDFESVDRQFYEVAPGETQTTTNELGLAWNVRPAKGVKFEAKIRHGEVDNPFLGVDAVYSTFTSPPATGGSPLAPNAAQYYQSHAGRIGDSTAMPSSYDELFARGSLMFGEEFGATASYKYFDGDNDEGDLTEWSRTSQTAIVSFWAMPSPQVQWALSYVWHDQELDMPASIPLFDG